MYQNVGRPFTDGKKKDDDLLFPSSSPMSRVKDDLDIARAMKPAMPEIDAAAKAYSDA